jgi:ferritin
MLKPGIEEILNIQVEKEGYSSNLYLARASWAENKGYKGISQWLYAQADEEKMHMLKFIAYINERAGKAIIPAFKQPPANFPGIKEMFESVLKHEEYITNSINEIVEKTIEEKDFTTHNWIQWFVTEQIEEEAQVRDLLDKLTLAGNAHLYLFDRDIMGMRGEGEVAESEN